MIYTITFNPCLDLKLDVKNFKKNVLNRYTNEYLTPGGKGINVSLMLKTLGVENTALGFKAGFTGEHLEKELNNKKIKTSFIKVPGQTRINFKINDNGETQLNGQGPLITNDKLQKLKNKINKLKSQDTLIISGSVPFGQTNAYQEIAAIAKKKKLKLIIDTNGKSLKESLKFKPFLIKPNKEEAEEVLKLKIKTEKDIIKTLLKFKKLGSQNILLSLGKNGAYLLTEENKIFKVRSVKGKVINTIGSGDAALAGLISILDKKADYKKAIIRAVASGTASAFTENLADKKSIIKIEKQLFVEEAIWK